MVRLHIFRLLHISRTHKKPMDVSSVFKANSLYSIDIRPCRAQYPKRNTMTYEQLRMYGWMWAENRFCSTFSRSIRCNSLKAQRCDTHNCFVVFINVELLSCDNEEKRGRNDLFFLVKCSISALKSRKHPWNDPFFDLKCRNRASSRIFSEFSNRIASEWRLRKDPPVISKKIAAKLVWTIDFWSKLL